MKQNANAIESTSKILFVGLQNGSTYNQEIVALEEGAEFACGMGNAEYLRKALLDHAHDINTGSAADCAYIEAIETARECGNDLVVTFDGTETLYYFETPYANFGAQGPFPCPRGWDRVQA